MKGFGIEFKDPNHYGDEDDPRICDHEISQGDQEKGRTAMENALQKCPDVNVVYTINEPAAAGAWEALKAAGKADGSVLIVSIDGGCPGVKNVEAGVIGATSQQYPHKMASMALEAIATGKIPPNDPKAWSSSTPAPSSSPPSRSTASRRSRSTRASSFAGASSRLSNESARLLRSDRESDPETVALPVLHRHRDKKGHE